MARETRFALISAFLLSGITLFVFWVLQGYGPASALRKFHIAVLSGDNQALRDLVSPDSHAWSVQLYGNEIIQYARAGGHYQLAGVIRKSDRRVVVVVNYPLPERTGYPVISWVVDREGNRWKVNTDETYWSMRLESERSMGL